MRDAGRIDRRILGPFRSQPAPRFHKTNDAKPTRIIVNHGERRKSDLFAQNVNRIFGIKTVVPDVLESLRLRKLLPGRVSFCNEPAGIAVSEPAVSRRQILPPGGGITMPSSPTRPRPPPTDFT